MTEETIKTSMLRWLNEEERTNEEIAEMFQEYSRILVESIGVE